MAVVLVLGTILMLGRLTAPPQGATSTPTTAGVISAPTTTIDIETFTIADIATGSRFGFIKAPSVGPVWPLDVLEHGDRIYLFGSAPSATEGGMGLSGWVSFDGIAWSSLGEVIPPQFSMTRVESTSMGLVALGYRLTDGTPFVWISPEGTEWRSSRLPVPRDDPPGSFYRLADLVEFEGRLLVAGGPRTEADRLLAPYLPAAVLGPDGMPYHLERSDGPDGRRIHVFGPLRISGFSATPEDLGLPQDIEAALFEGTGPRQQYLWSSANGRSWEVEPLEIGNVTRLWRHGHGLVATGHDGRNPLIWLSGDGTRWDTLPRTTRAWIHGIDVKTVWRDMLVAVGTGKDVFASADGVEWEPITQSPLPDGLDWSLHPVASSSTGLAVVATASRDDRAASSPVVIEKDGYTLGLDMAGRTLTLEFPGMSVLYGLAAEEPSDFIEVDFPSRVVTFSDPESGEPLVSLDFATLERAETASTRFRPRAGKALLFNSDGEQWDVQDLTEQIGGDRSVVRLAVLGDRVVLITQPTSHHFRSMDPPGISILVGILK